MSRLQRAIPLASIYLWLCFVYLIEAGKHVTPWLFTDELELTQLSRSIAKTGRAARRGQAHSFDSLYTVITAPFWLIHNTQTAYDAVKYFDVLVMASVLFPTYGLARLVVGRRWALFAAAGAAVTPALAYSSWIVEETLAYPYAALCLYVFAKALVALQRSVHQRAWVAVAVVVGAIAPAVRGQLVVIPAAGLLALAFSWWSSDAQRERRATWSRADWLGVITIVVGASFAISALVGHHSLAWYSVTTYYKHRFFVMGDWSIGSLAIGLGVVPFVLGLAALFRADETPSMELRMFRCVSAAGLITFGYYTALKAAYLSTTFATRTEERNIIYIAPLLFVGTAIVLERRRVNLLALLGAAAYALYLITGTPFRMDVQLYSDALGTALFEQLNRYFGDPWSPGFAQWITIAMLAVGVALTLAVVRLRRPGLAPTIAAVALGALVLAWNLSGEVAAAVGTVSISRDVRPTLREPFRWVDQVAHGAPTLYLGQGEIDQNPEWLLEFWNRSVSAVGSLDGTLGGPGPTSSPNLTPSGKLYWTHNPNVVGRTFTYAVEDWPCVDFDGTEAANHLYRGGAKALKEWRLIRLTIPNRMRAECTGLYPDTWQGPKSSYFHFTAAPNQWLRVTVSRKDWGGDTGPTPVHVYFATIVNGRGYEPKLGRLLKRVDLTINSSQAKVVWIRTPSTPFAAEVVVDKTFVPRLIDPHLSDPRVLGAEVTYTVVPTKP